MDFPVYLFVYGTLKRGGLSHHLLGFCPFLGTVTTLPRYTLIDMGDYPALLDDGCLSVTGEVYEVPADLIAEIDYNEDSPHHFVRRGLKACGPWPLEAYFLRTNWAGYSVVYSGEWDIAPPIIWLV